MADSSWGPPQGMPAGVVLAQTLATSVEGRALARGLASNVGGRVLAWDLATSAKGRALALDLASNVRRLALGEGRDLARALANLADGAAGRDLAQTLATSDAGQDLARALATSVEGQDLARALPALLVARARARSCPALLVARVWARSCPALLVARARARSWATSNAGQDLAQTLATSNAGQDLARALATSNAGQDLAQTLADGAAGRDLAASAVFGLSVLGGLAVWFGLNLSAGTALVWFVAGVAARVDDDEAAGESPDQDRLSEAVKDLVFTEHVRRDEAGDLRGALERLIGHASVVLETVEFDDPLVEEKILRDRNFLRDELAASPDIDAKVVVPLVARLEAALVQLVPADEPGRALVEDLAGTPAENPEDPAHAGAQAETLAEALEATGDDPPDGEDSWRDWLATRLGWARPTTADVATAGGGLLSGLDVAQRLGIGGAPAIIVGAVVSVLAVVFRRRRGAS